MFVGDPSLDAEAYAGVMTWEDGSSSALRFERIADDRFEVYVDATFDRPGRQKADYVITGAGMQRTGSVEFNVYQNPVSPPPIGQVRVQSVNAVKGIAYSLVSAFTPADPSIPISQYSAEIGWGDGSSSPAELRLGPDGQIQIIAEHTYRRVVNSGDYGPYVYVHVRLGERSAYTQTWVSVAVDPTRINAFGRDDMHFRQREEFTSRVGYFTSPDEHAKASDFEVWIDWGDGKQSLGTVVSRFEGGFDVLGTHTYKVSGYRNITFTVAGPTNADTGESRITLDRDPVEVTPRKPDIGKRSIKGTLATFIDEDGDSTDSERYRVYHAALIDWGDGRFDFGQVVREVDGTFRVDGAHTYRKSGEYLVKLFVRRNERYLPGMYSPVMYDVAARNGLSHAGIQGSEEYSSMLFKVRIGKSTAKVLAGRKSAPPLQKAPVRAASLFSTMRIPRDLGLLA